MQLKPNYSMQKEQSSQVRQRDDKTLSQEHSNNIYYVILTTLVESSTVRNQKVF